MADKRAHDALPDDITDAQIRGLFNKWLYDRDWTIVGDSEVTIPCNPETKADIPILAYQDFEEWMGRQLDDFLEYRDDMGGKDRWISVFVERYKDDEQFSEEVKSHVKFVKTSGEVIDEEEYHAVRQEEGHVDEDDSEQTHRFPELAEVGIVDREMNIDAGKLRGAMVHFVNDVDEIVGTEPQATPRQFRQAFSRYMMEKFDQEWIHLTSEILDPDDLQDNIDWLWQRKDDFVDQVDESYVVDRSEMEGNSDQEESSDDGDEDDGVDNPSGISEWAEVGSETESSEADDNKSNGSSSTTGSLGGATRRDITVDKSADRELKRNHIYHENCYVAMEKLPKNSVDCVVTSPPYYDLRDYHGVDSTRIGGDPNCNHSVNVKNRCTDCGAWFGQLGNEPEPEMFIDNIISLMKRIDRVLKPHGTLFLNVGDTYAKSERSRKENRYKVPKKSMMMVPERIALKMMDTGWSLRNRIVWAKQVMFEDKTVQGNANPCSFTDRLNYTDEPLFFFTHNTDYFFDLDSIRREHQTEGEAKAEYSGSKFNEDEIDDENIGGAGARASREGYEPSFYHDEGANLPSVWQINPGKCGDLHTAVFSEMLPADPIEAGCPEETCAMCGKPVVDGERFCSCPTEETEPGVVMDPFTGRGTTLKVALQKGRDYVGIEASDEYIEIARDYVPDTRQQKLI